MRSLDFRILNVFTVGGDRLSGNPLAVFEDGSGLSSKEMMALARQFNLSETTFVLPPSVDGATARVRIFTPTIEMPFAGHPTLGTAQVVRDLKRSGDHMTLEMQAGLVEVQAKNEGWTLKTARAPETRAPSASREEMARMVGLEGAAIAEDPLWVDTGAEQLVIPLASVEQVTKARPDPELLARLGFSEKRNESMAYVWARKDEGTVIARFFFVAHGGVVEDPATGSACANLGGYLIATGRPLPIALTISQGDAVGRPSRLRLEIDRQRNVFVGGDVIEIARGQLEL